MQIYKVLGSVTLSRSHAGFVGARLLATEPVGASCIGAPAPLDPDLVVVWDDLGAGAGSLIAVSDGAEAAQPFRPSLKAVDAYNCALLDSINFVPEVVERITWT